MHLFETPKVEVQGVKWPILLRIWACSGIGEINQTTNVMKNEMDWENLALNQA